LLYLLAPRLSLLAVSVWRPESALAGGLADKRPHHGRLGQPVSISQAFYRCFFAWRKDKSEMFRFSHCVHSKKIDWQFVLIYYQSITQLGEILGMYLVRFWVSF
jgi:hypothetical protein